MYYGMHHDTCAAGSFRGVQQVVLVVWKKRGRTGMLFLDIVTQPRFHSRFYRLGIQWAFSGIQWHSVETGTKIMGEGMTLGPEWPGSDRCLAGLQAVMCLQCPWATSSLPTHPAEKRHPDASVASWLFAQPQHPQLVPKERGWEVL